MVFECLHCVDNQSAYRVTHPWPHSITPRAFLTLSEWVQLRPEKPRVSTIPKPHDKSHKEWKSNCIFLYRQGQITL